MFVKTNSLSAIKQYFKEALSPTFSEREISFFYKQSVAHRMNVPISEIILLANQLLSESDLLFFHHIIRRLNQNEPFQYVLGETEFYGLQLKCDKRALIPRPETEELVDWVVHSEYPEMPKIVDVCSGSGCIALGIKSKIRHAQVVGVDISHEAIELSIENANSNHLQVDFIELDILKQQLPFEDASLDVLVSNPPYVLEREKSEMNANVLNFEPHIALFVENKNPMLFYECIIQKAYAKLKKGGRIYFEINEKYANETTQLLEASAYSNVIIKTDLQAKDRMVSATKH